MALKIANAAVAIGGAFLGTAAILIGREFAKYVSDICRWMRDDKKDND